MAKKQKIYLGFNKDDIVGITNDYCLDTRNDTLLYAGGITGKEIVRQNKHYLKSLECIIIEKSKIINVFPKLNNNISKEKIKKFISITDKLMKDCWNECKDFCKSCHSCKAWKKYNKQKNELLGEK